jgi:hypothetical protein
MTSFHLAYLFWVAFVGSHGTSTGPVTLLCVCMEIIQTVTRLLMHTAVTVVGLGISILTLWELLEKRIAKFRSKGKCRPANGGASATFSCVTGLFYAGFKAPDFETAIRKRHSVWMQTITVRALIGLNGWTEHVSILHASNYVKRQCPLAKHLVLVFRERHFLADRGDRIVHRDDRRCGVGIVGAIFHCSICSLLKWPDDIPGVGVFGVNGWRSPLVLNVHRHQDVINTINHCNCTGSLLTISYNFKCASRSWREIGALFHSELPLREAESVPAGFGGVCSGVQQREAAGIHRRPGSTGELQTARTNDFTGSGGKEKEAD